MSNRDVLALSRSCAAAAVELVATLKTGTLQRMADAMSPLRAGAMDGAPTSGRGPADPTQAFALAAAPMADAHAGELRSALMAACTALQAAGRLAALYPPPHPSNADDRAALARLNGREDHGCASCARLALPDGRRRWEPIDSRLKDATTVGGRLAEAMLLCVWCVERTRAWGRLPTPAECARHHAGSRVPWPADVPRPA